MEDKKDSENKSKTQIVKNKNNNTKDIVNNNLNNNIKSENIFKENKTKNEKKEEEDNIFGFKQKPQIKNNNIQETNETDIFGNSVKNDINNIFPFEKEIKNNKAQNIFSSIDKNTEESKTTNKTNNKTIQMKQKEDINDIFSKEEVDIEDSNRRPYYIIKSTI